MTTSTRWLWVAVGVLVVGLVGIGVYTVRLQAQLSSDIKGVEDGLTAELSQTEQRITGQLTRTAESLSSDLTAGLASLSDRLKARGDELAAELHTLDSALGGRIDSSATELRGSVQSVRARLDEVRAELATADTALRGEITSQTTTLRGDLEGVSQTAKDLATGLGALGANLDALSTDLDALSTDLDALEQEASLLMAKTARSLLDVEPLYDKMKGSVVEILDQGANVVGSGIVYGPKARHVVTAAHVVEGILPQVRLPSGATIAPVTVVLVNDAEDLAVLDLGQSTSVPPLHLATPSELAIGQPVLVIGSPARMKGSASTGIISGLGRAVGDFGAGTLAPGHSPTNLVQIDAFAYGGNSGGPVVNSAGEVVGIISFGLVDSIGKDGPIFAVACAVIRALADPIVGA